MSTAADSSTRESLGAKYAHPLAWILLLGTVVRIVLWVAWGNWSPLMNDDAVDYQGLATRLVTTGEYTSIDGTRISLRPPLYPAIVAATYCVAGVGNDAAVRAEQAIVSLLTVLVVYRLGILVYNRRVATVAAAISCFYPALLAYANLLLSETWFTFFAVGFACLALEAVHRQSLSLLAAAGVAIALAALTRSIMLLFVPCFCAYLLWAWPGSWTRKILTALVPAAVFALVIAPWAVRNTRLQETLTMIDVMGGRNAMMGNYEHTPTERSWATITDAVGDKAWYRVLLKDSKNASPGSQGKLDKLALSHAIRFVLANPGLTLKRDVVKFFNFWQLERTFLAAARSGYFGQLSLPSTALIAAVTCGASAVVLIAAIFGITCVPPANLRDHLFLVGSILFPCAIHSLIFAHERYRLPVMPLLAIYAAAALVDWPAIWARRKAWVFRIAVVLCLVLVAGWLRELVMVDLKLAEQLLG